MVRTRQSILRTVIIGGRDKRIQGKCRVGTVAWQRRRNATPSRARARAPVCSTDNIV